MGSRFILIPSISKGGAERVAVNLLPLFDYIIVLDGRNIYYDIPQNKMIDLGIPSTSNLFKKFVNLVFRYRKLKKIKKEMSRNVCLSLLEPANLLNILTRTEEKVILSFHSNYSNTFKNDPFFGRGFSRKLIIFLYKLAFRLLYTKADALVAVSKESKKDLVKHFGFDEKKLKVIYNPILVKSIDTLSEESIESYEPIFANPVLITVGRLTKQKGQWYLLRIFRYLKKDFPDFRLVILGDGELKDYLAGLSERLGLKTYVWDRDRLSKDYDVYFLGFQKNPFKFVARAKLFVFPSLWEGLPYALIEAMACGVLVISSDCRSGPREILAPDTDFEYQTTEPEFAKYGILMPVFETKFKEADEPLDRTETIWLETLKKILSDSELLQNYSQKARLRAMDFNIDKIMEEWKKLFVEVGVYDE